MNPVLKRVLFWLSYSIIFSINVAHAQFFGLRQNNPRNYYSTVLKYPKDSLYRVYSITYPGSILNNTIQPIIYVYNKNLQLKDSILLPKNYSFDFLGPVESNSKLYWMAANNSFTCGYTGITICSGDTISVLTFNNDYAVTFRKKITRDYNYGKQRLVKYNGGFFYSHTMDANFPYGTEKIFKLNKQLIVIDSIFFNSVIVNPIAFIHSKIFLPGESLPSLCNSTIAASSGSPRLSLMLDTNLAVLSCDSYSNLGTYTANTTPPGTQTLKCIFYPMPYLGEISQTKYIVFGSCSSISGTLPNFSTNHGIIACIKDRNQNIIKTNFITNDFFETSFTEVGNFYDIDRNKIAFAAKVDGIGAGNFNVTLNLKSKIMVVKMDTMGNVLWKKQYGGDMYYQPRGLIITGDGGFLVSGIRFDSTSSAQKGMPGISESFLLKLDSNGNYNSVGVFENGSTKQNSIKCFPNPTSSQLFFDVPFEENLSIEILDLLGKQILKVEDYKNYSALDTKEFNKGVYLYRIKTKNNFYYGKFLKE